MRRMLRTARLALPFAAGLAMLAPQVADAKPVNGLAIINTGEDIYPVGPLPDAIKDIPEIAGHEVGMKCSVFGVFWVMLHHWDCEAVVYMPGTTNYYDASAFDGAFNPSDYEKGDANFGFMGGTARWLLLAGVVIAIVIGARGAGKDEEAPAGEAA